MNRFFPEPNGLLGLSCVDGAHVHLVALRRTRSGLDVLAQHSATVTPGATLAGAAAELFEQLDVALRAWPVVVCTGQRGLHRRITRPRANDATVQKMLDLWLESQFADQAGQLRYGWCRADEAGALWVHVLNASAVEEAKAMLPSGATFGGVVSPEMAMAALWREAGDGESAAVLRWGGQDASLMFLSGDGRVGSLVGVEPDGLEDRAMTAAALQEALGEALQDAPPAVRPGKLLLPDPTPDDVRQCASSWAMVAVNVREVVSLGLDDPQPGMWYAAGAALALVERNAAVVGAIDARVMRARSNRRAATWAAVAAAWLVVAVVGLYFSTLHAASRLSDDAAAAAPASEALVRLDRQTALARYLESRGPTALAVLDDVAQRTRQTLFDEVRFASDGELNLRGKVRSADDVSKLVTDLAEATTLEAVQLVQQKQVSREEIEFHIVAQPSKRFAGAFVAPKPEANGADEAEGHGESQRERRGGAPDPRRARVEH